MNRAWIVLALTACAASASAQPVEMAPLQCWWRTSAPAIRIGEAFSVVLTCSVVENDAVKVVPDETPLDPTAMQMAPFEVLGGTHHADLRADNHRFFQYDYRLRLISEDLFGKDVKLPDLKITYRVQSRVNGSAIEGMEKTYFLPVQSVRVLSLVPADAADIRDAATSTFGDVESRVFRAEVFTTVAGVLFAIAGLMLVLALVSLVRRYRAPRTATTNLTSDAAILRATRAELASLARQRQGSGWTSALAGRLLAALRILAGYALSRPIVQTAAPVGYTARDGEILVRGGWTRGKSAVVSGAATPQAIDRELRSSATTGVSGTWREPLLAELQPALARLTASHYGREPLQDDRFDDALAVGLRVARRLRIEQTWPVRKLRAARRAGTELGQRVWSH